MAKKTVPRWKNESTRWHRVAGTPHAVYHSKGSLKPAPGVEFSLLCCRTPPPLVRGATDLFEASHLYWCTYRVSVPVRRFGWGRDSVAKKVCCLFSGQLQLEGKLADSIAWQFCYLLQKDLHRCQIRYFLSHSATAENSNAIDDYWERNAANILKTILK